MPLIENFHEFKARQNCEAIQVQQSDFEDRWLFANGAGCILKKLGLKEEFLIREPSNNKQEALHDRREFVLAKLAQESKAYEYKKNEYQQMANNAAKYPESCPAVPARAMDELRARWDGIEVLQKELGELNAELAPHSPATQRRQLAERDAANFAERKRTADEFTALGFNAPPPAPAFDERALFAMTRHQPPTSDLFGAR